jgi:PAS domain S-box-containing protein
MNDMDTILKSKSDIPEFLMGGGEMGQRIRDFDWSKTPLGPVTSWPRSLCTCVQIMLTSRQPIWIGWGKELIKLYNDPYREIVGGKHPWALGKPASVVWKDIWKDIESMLRQVMLQNEGTYVESQLLIMERNGYPEETYYTFSYTPIAGDDGRTEGMICFNTDDTDRIISERQLLTLTKLGKSLTDPKTNQEVYERSINTMKENCHDFPFALVYELSTDQASLVNFTDLGTSRENIPECINLNAPDEISQLAATAISQRKYQIHEDLRKKIGDMPKGAWAVPPDKAIVLPIAQRGQKRPYGLLVIGINPYRLLDEKYQSFFELITDQIATSLGNVYAMEEERKRLDALADIDRAKTTFFSNISHEFRTPLTLLLAPIEDLVNDAAITGDNRQRASVALRNAFRLQKLVNLLLDFSRIEAGRMEANFTAVDIVSLTEELASNFRSAIEKAGMTLVVNTEPIDEPVYVDVDMWEKIVLNLLSNAFKYSEEGSIEVSVSKADAGIEVSVKDTGIGIPENEIEKIFDRFHRVQNVKGRSQEGTGIGLAMVKELVKLHGGTITVKSKMDEGSVFAIYVPFGTDRSRNGNSATKSSSRSIAQSATYVEEALQWIPEAYENKIHGSFEHTISLRGNKDRKQATVLLADDNADMRKYVQRLLAADYQVIAVGDGEEAFVKAVQHVPDLILSDIMMPRLDGFGLLQKLKTNLSTRNIPIIFLSARAGEEAKVEGLKAGADDYLTKPFSSRELLARVNNHITISNARRKTEREFYNLFLQSPAHIHVFKGPEHVVEFFHPLGIAFAGRDITGMKIREALPQMEGQGFFEMLDTVYREGTPIHLNESKATFPNDKGDPIDYYFNLTYLPWKDLEGNVQGVLQFTFEVTETVEQRLRAEANEKKFRSIAQQAPVAMAVLKGPSHIVEVANDRVLEMWGKKYDEVIDQPVLSVFPEIANQGFREILANVYKTGEPWIASEMPVTFMRNGIAHHMLVNLLYEPFRNEKNEIDGILAVGTDVTEQVLARNKVAEAEERLRIATEILELGTWEYDPINDIIHSSKKTVQLFGFKAGTKISLKDAIGAIADTDRQRVIEAVQWALNPQSNGVYDIEYSVNNLTDGKQRTIRANGQAFFDAANKPLRLIGTALDITERKKAEQEIKASEARFRLLATSIPQIVWTTDKEGNTNYISGQFEKYTGRKASESLQSWKDLVHPDDKAKFISARDQAIKHGTGWQEEFRLRDTYTGSYRWFLGNSQPLKDSDGNIMLWIGSASDIQVLKEQSNWLEQQVQERTRALKELNQSLKLSNEDLQQFAHVAGHDLKEPIRKIKTYSNRLQDDYSHLLPEKGGTFLTKILSATDRMYSMIDGVLSYSTMAAADQPAEKVNLNTILKNIENDLEVLIHEKKATIEVEKLPTLEGAPVLLYQLFYNLINNSIKFSRADVLPVIKIKSIIIELENNQFAKIIVSDNGIGFEQENAEKIFTTFTRLNSKDKYEGTGLGLALCKKIVQRHGGFISARGEKSNGAEFTILLPLNS